MTPASMALDVSGKVTEWTFYSLINDSVAFQIWRPAGGYVIKLTSFPVNCTVPVKLDFVVISLYIAIFKNFVHCLERGVSSDRKLCAALINIAKTKLKGYMYTALQKVCAMSACTSAISMITR